jgi:hypothetical protein
LLFMLAGACWLPAFALPAVIISAVFADRERFVLQDMLLTGASPLRLVSAKLKAIGVPLTYMTLVGFACSSPYCCAASGFSVLQNVFEPTGGQPGTMVAVWFIQGLRTPVLVLSWGAVALHFALRCRSRIAALSATYALLIGVQLLEILLASGLVAWTRAEALVPVAMVAVTALTFAAGLFALRECALAGEGQRAWSWAEDLGGEGDGGAG